MTLPPVQAILLHIACISISNFAAASQVVPGCLHEQWLVPCHPEMHIAPTSIKIASQTLVSNSFMCQRPYHERHGTGNDRPIGNHMCVCFGRGHFWWQATSCKAEGMHPTLLHIHPWFTGLHHAPDALYPDPMLSAAVFLQQYCNGLRICINLCLFVKVFRLFARDTQSDSLCDDDAGSAAADGPQGGLKARGHPGCSCQDCRGEAEGRRAS